MITLELITGLVRELSPLPQTAAHLAALLANKNWTVDACVDIIRYDQALTADVLKYANSAFAAANRKISDIRDAVIRLGGGRILEDLLARHLHRDFTVALPAYGYDERDLWRHSVAAAIAAESLSAYAGVPVDGLAFTAALLHDIGKLMLARVAPRDDMEAVWKRVTGTRCSCEQAEKEVLGVTHAECGAAVIAAWGLPGGIVVGVKNHHASNDPADPMTDCVMVANVVARSIGEGIGHEGMNIGGDALVGKRLGLTKEKFEQLCARTRFRFQEVVGAFQ
jgi:putative nucleotidyltransferase with HDIG domain